MKEIGESFNNGSLFLLGVRRVNPGDWGRDSPNKLSTCLPMHPRRAGRRCLSELQIFWHELNCPRNGRVREGWGNAPEMEECGKAGAMPQKCEWAEKLGQCPRNVNGRKSWGNAPEM